MQRLAIVLTGLYLVGLGIYAAIVWWLFTTQNVNVWSPLLYREAVRYSGERDRILPGIPYLSDSYAQVDDRFDWLAFGFIASVGVGAIWLLLPGPVWLVRWIRGTKASEPTPETGTVP